MVYFLQYKKIFYISFYVMKSYLIKKKFVDSFNHKFIPIK